MASDVLHTRERLRLLLLVRTEKRRREGGAWQTQRKRERGREREFASLEHAKSPSWSREVRLEFSSPGSLR
ncbi:hypothetical protein MA16_Dca010698 [Dendrobium catenatum]|uniref:Uncharacterized protein n=1 Tax=Dendrobium catenatum TaxID=906689 RepID=A0A2I0VK37_9ASPA|nr:hypothetical protein MA16_Dca010698 [Dendrobium catenatum]